MSSASTPQTSAARSGGYARALGHERLDAEHVLLDEGAIEAADALELDRERPGQHHVGARPQREVQVRLLGRP